MKLSALDTNLLVVLDAVLEERSVTRAAQRIHVTPAAVSNALARLRPLLKDPLVTRSGRGIVPTPRARELAPTLRRALEQLETVVVGGAAFDAKSTDRLFSLAVADAGQIARAPKLAALVAHAMPRARLRIVSIDSLVSLGGLANTEVDAVVGPGEHAPGIRSEKLHDEPVVLIGRQATAPRRLTLAGLSALRHVGVDMAPGRGLQDVTATAYARARIPRDVAVVVPSFTAAAAVVAATDLVATLPASLVTALGASLGVRVISAPIPATSVPMNLWWHERTHRDPACVTFRALVRRAYGR